MKTSTIEPTRYADVNAVLAALLPEITAILGDGLVGAYLFGSLALGDFDPASSDIDLIVVTGGPVPDDQFNALGAMHLRFDASPPGQTYRMEVCYMPRADMRRFEPDAGPFPSWGEEGWHWFTPGGDWIIQRHILREHEAVVMGPSPRAMIDPVSPDDLRWGVADVLQGWWIEQVDRPAWLSEQTPHQVFGVQTMCRALNTLALGHVVSKPDSLRWAVDTLGEPWAALAAAASGWKKGMPFVPLEDTLALIRHTVERSRAFRVIHAEPVYQTGGRAE